MSVKFDKKFENWLNEQLQSIKSLTSFGNQVKEHPALRENSQLQYPSTAFYHSITNIPQTHSRSQFPSAAMSRSNRPSLTSKHGGNYYRFAYDEDDVQSFDDVTVEDDVEYDDEEKRRRVRLTRILGDECLDFGSETGFEMDDEFTAKTSMMAPSFDENRNHFDQSNLAESRANNYSTTSLEFSDVESYVSATASDVTGLSTPIRFSGDWADATDGVASGISGLDGFVEFSRVRDEKKSSSVDQPLTLADDDDPLKYGSTKPPTNTVHQRLLPPGLIAAISGRVNRNKTAQPGADNRTKEMIAVRYHKTDVSSGELPGDDFMDDDDMLVHPQRHQLPVGDVRTGSSRVASSATSAAGATKDNYFHTTRGFLPVDLSMDIMSTDDAFSAADFEDRVSDDIAMHSRDRDPIVKTPSQRHSSSAPFQGSSPQQFVWSSSDISRTGSQHCRRVLIVCGVIGGVLLLVGIGVSVFLVRRYKE